MDILSVDAGQCAVMSRFGHIFYEKLLLRIDLDSLFLICMCQSTPATVTLQSQARDISPNISD